MTTSSVSVGSQFRVYSDYNQRMTNMFITITKVYERDGKTVVDGECYQNGTISGTFERSIVCSNWIPQ
jgi:hypothetical protein